MSEEADQKPVGKQGPSRGFWLTLSHGVLIVLMLFAWFYNDAPGGQRYHMALAAKHVPAVESVLASDPQFKDVHTSVYTGAGGALGITGHVESDEAYFKLLKEVAKLHLPVTVFWSVDWPGDYPGK